MKDLKMLKTLHQDFVWMSIQPGDGPDVCFIPGGVLWRDAGPRGISIAMQSMQGSEKASLREKILNIWGDDDE